MSLFNRPRCYKGGSQHAFQARYTERDRPQPMSLTGVLYFPGDAPDVLQQLREVNTLREYVGDICVWCGMTKKP